jgi:hypothetical protein
MNAPILGNDHIVAMIVIKHLDIRIVSGGINRYIVRRGNFLMMYVRSRSEVGGMWIFISAYIEGDGESVIGHSDTGII